MKIGITGGTGGLGRRLTEFFVNKGYKVKLLIRNTSRLDEIIKWEPEIVFGDINDKSSVAEFIKGIDICYHIAAQVATSSREEYFKVNVGGTTNICDAICGSNPSCRLIYCSSIVVKEVNPFSRFFLSDYTLSKYAAEQEVNKYIHNAGLKVTIIYPGYIYGPYDRNFMPTLMKMLENGLNFLIKGGEKDASVVYMDDLCELFYLAGISEVAIGKRYVSLKPSNVGMHQFLKIVADKAGYSFPDKVYPKAPLVVLAFFLGKLSKILNRRTRSVISMRIIGLLSKRGLFFYDDAKKDLGWEHKIVIEDGISKAIEWQKNNH